MSDNSGAGGLPLLSNGNCLEYIHDTELYMIGDILNVKKSSKDELDRIMQEAGITKGNTPFSASAIVSIMNILDAKDIPYYIGR